MMFSLFNTLRLPVGAAREAIMIVGERWVTWVCVNFMLRLRRDNVSHTYHSQDPEAIVYLAAKIHPFLGSETQTEGHS